MKVQHDFHGTSVQQIRDGKGLRMSWVWKDLHSNAPCSPLYDGYKHGSSPSSERDPSPKQKCLRSKLGQQSLHTVCKFATIWINGMFSLCQYCFKAYCVVFDQLFSIREVIHPATTPCTVFLAVVQWGLEHDEYRTLENIRVENIS